MKLKVSELYSEFQNKIFEIPSKDLADRGVVYKTKIITAKLSLFKEINYLYLKGNLKTTLEYTCVRCLKKNPSKTDIPINILILEETMNYTSKTDYDTLYFNKSDDYVNLKNILADLIALAEPIKTLCKKECTGLCPTCGKEKNNSCNCNVHSNNDTWNKLKDLQF
tara:strand:+ start:476 stop:973 length:498 start_codon:yes stop_codon:yes gene_type:complete